MAVIVPNDPEWGFLTFGDTDGTLGDRAVADGQTIQDLDSSISNLRVATQVGDARVLSERATGGDDNLLIANRQNATIFGDAFEMDGRAHGGADTISASGEFTAVAYGDAQTLAGRAVGGNDHLTGTSLEGRVVLYGDALTLGGHAKGGDDLLVAHAADATNGMQGSDLYGDGQTLAGHARGGNDTLVSGQGADDRMWGDAANLSPHAQTGVDLFVFQAANGHDVIEDFERGKDHIDLHQTAYHSFADLAGVLQNTAQGALLQFDAGASILIAGVHNLSAGDFVFT